MPTPVQPDSGLTRAPVSAWASNPKERTEIETRIRGVGGHELKAVRYLEMDYGDGQRAWDAADGFDSLDYGIELDLDTGQTWSVIWRQFDLNEAVLVYEGVLLGVEVLRRHTVRMWDVTDRWRTLGPAEISDVGFAWSRQSVGPGVSISTGEAITPARESDLCLATVVLSSDAGGEAVLTLGEQHEGCFRGIPDNIAVFFSTAEARAAGVILPDG